jgi:hypothetical protein
VRNKKKKGKRARTEKGVEAMDGWEKGRRKRGRVEEKKTREIDR